MTKATSTWSATALGLLTLHWASTTTTTTAFLPVCQTRSHTSLLPVAATPVSPSVNPTNNSTEGSGNRNGDFAAAQFHDLHEANMALDALAMKCSQPAREPVIHNADECQSQWEAMHGSALEPDTVSFNTVLKAWSKCCHALADYRRNADANPPMMESSASQNTDHPQVYTAKDAAERATLLLLSQEQEYENGEVPESARPDTQSYNEAIGAWARSGVAEAPQNAERLLKRMLDHEYIVPDGFSYNGVVDAWAYSGKPEAVQKVKQIWQHMEQLYADHNEENDHSEDEGAIIKPTIRTVNSIIQAHAKRVQELIETRDIDGARKTAHEAEEYLDLMKERYEQTQDPDHCPDVMTYTTVMDTLGRCGNYRFTMRAQALLEELKEIHQQSNGKNHKMKPNVRTYTSLISAWSKTRAYQATTEAMKLLEEMENSEDPDLRPNSRTYTSVIHAWARSNDHDKAQRALQILTKMRNLYKETGDENYKPTLITYNAALDTCARCQGDLHQQTDALKIALAVFKTIQQDPDMEPNAITFSTLLRACNFLLQPGEERNKVSIAVFEKAKKAGMVDFRVMVQLRKALDNDHYQALLENDCHQDRNGNFDFNNLPPGWSRNVR